MLVGERGKECGVGTAGGVLSCSETNPEHDWEVTWAKQFLPYSLFDGEH